MQVQTLLLIILAAIISIGIVLYQYFKQAKKNRKLYLVLMAIRFLAIFGILLLLINPKFLREEFTIQKSNLLLLIDNSSSIQKSGISQEVGQIVDQISTNGSITNKYDIRFFTFDRDLSTSDSISFNRSTTDINNSLRTLRQIYNNQNSAVVLMSDGNQTIGTDYEYFNAGPRQSIFPVVLGDTTKYEDVVIERVNVNKFAFLDNQYPVEILIRYQGESEITTPLNVSVDGTIRYRESVRLNRQDNSKNITVLLKANSVGVKLINVELGSLVNEKNTSNNVEKVALEVVDERTNVAIISSINHPDLGTLKKSIETNNQRSVQLFKPSVDLEALEEMDILVLYQPTRVFERIYQFTQTRKFNTFTITGPSTDWNYLNRIQNSFQKNSYDQTEEVAPVLNAGFSTFDISDFNVNDFPPLTSNLGDLLVTKASDVIMEQRIRGVDLGDPLFLLIRDNEEKHAALFGENIWKWRVQTYRNDEEFTKFDEFMAKIILFLSSDQNRQRLSLEYDNIYRDANLAKIRASYFDETFEFDTNANITLYISGLENNIRREIPMLLKGSYYEADLSGLAAGTFNFTVKVEGDNLMRSGQFTILDFDVEGQFMTADYEKLNRLAERSGGRSYFPDQSEELINNLIGDERFKPTQKSEQNIVSLIDFKILLALVVGAFTAEWFIRKYNGLI